MLRDGQAVDLAVVPTVGGDYDAALQLFEKKEYAQAEPIFRKIADNSKNMPKVCESARWWQAECFYNQGQYPDAAERYSSISAMNSVTLPVAKLGRSLTAACPSSDDMPACSASRLSNVSSAMRW